jgi:hypothetical protein
MNRNPYAAPKSAVSDVPAAPMERPRVVVIAVALFWTEVTLGLLDSALDWKYLTVGDSAAFTLIVEALFVGLSVLINIKIWQGRNWARIVALVLTLVAMAGYATQVGTEFARAPFITVLAIIELLLDIVGLYLVFVPGRAWFARR